MIITSAFVLAVMPAITVFFSITRSILAFVPVITHKQDPLAAGSIFVTVLLPISGVPRRDAQIEWRAIHGYPPFNDYRLSVENPWLRVITDVNLTIKAGLTDTNRDTNIGSECRDSESGSGNYR
jgi:hypothetical protein